MKKLSLTVLAGWACLALGVQAAELRPEWVYGQLAAGRQGTYSATLGLAWPWDWRTAFAGGEVTGQTEAYISHWSAEAIGGGRQSLTQLGLVPVLRLRFDQGRSNWFVEAGIGVSWLDKIYRTPDKRTSTAGNFHDMLGVGRSFGPNRDRELSLRYVHFSNADIKKPNPGVDFLQLRYAVKF
jgi:lipid A 3-O-deacylase